MQPEIFCRSFTIRISRSGSPGALLRRGPLRTVLATRRGTRLKQAQRRAGWWKCLRTLLRSPACDAAKIRCRRRRTSSSTARQSTACQSRAAPSGPFTTTVSNLSFSSGSLINDVFAGSPDPRGHPFGSGHQARYPASYPRRPAEELAVMSRFPAAFRRTGIRFSGRPSPAKGFRLPHGRPTTTADSGGGP
jgi:hypothetical protein